MNHFLSFLINRIVLALVAFTAIFCLAAAAFGQQNEITSSGSGKITGRVINDSGEPISHAAITVFANGTTQPRRTSTDESGYFEISDLSPLVYLVSASAPAYYPPPRNPDEQLNYHRIGDTVNISLIKGGVLTGVVTNAIGEPAVQASVSAFLIRDANGDPPPTFRPPTEKVTDDRGVYRIYGLVAGTYLVSAGGRAFGFNPNAYESNSPTYAPSSARDTASEVVVRAGEETSGIDIRLRGEEGHVISGNVIGTTIGERDSINFTLKQMVNGSLQQSLVSFQPPNKQGFALYGIADGEYELTAQSFSAVDSLASEPLRVIVKGKNVSGLNVVLKPLGAINGKVIMESSGAAECKNKHQLLLSETIVSARVIRPGNLPTPPYSSATSRLDNTGEFTLRMLGPGRFSLSSIFFAKYWYLRSIKRPAVAGGKTAAANQQVDVARDGLNLKFGERVSAITMTLAEGAASLRGTLKLPENATVPPKLFVHLVPAEKESAEDVLRFFTTSVGSDTTFAFSNLAPGKYFVLARLSPDNEPQYDARLRAPDAATMRALLRRAAEAGKTQLELKPCQNAIDYQVPFEIAAPKN